MGRTRTRDTDSNTQRPKTDAAPAEPSRYRSGVGIMLLNRDGKVLVARRIDMATDAWQMPQGGIAKGESPRTAAFRELKEEIGTDHAEIVNETTDWLHYDLPNQLMGKVWGGRWRGQRQKWFVMRFLGEDAEINLSTSHPEFNAWRWASLEELPGLVASFKRQVYLDLVAQVERLPQRRRDLIVELMADPIFKLLMAADKVREDEMYVMLRQAAGRLRGDQATAPKADTARRSPAKSKPS